jgi:hypothetical protein
VAALNLTHEAMFNINDKVVCIDDSPGVNDGIKALTKGTVYCVTGWDGMARTHRSGLDGVFLAGVPNYHNERGEHGWNRNRFRLVSEVQAANRAKRKEKS